MRTFGALLALAIVLRIAAMIWVPLVPEEAYYWMYSQHPSLSYYDHPPMVAWMIGLGTATFGDTEFGVRLIGSVLMLGASVLLYAYSRMWFGRTAALMSAAALQVLPGVTIALRQQRAWGWYLAGFGLGAAMLSKYTGVFLAIGTVLAVVAYRPWRRHLRSAHPYLAVLLAGAMFSPVLVWNARHEWASFQFQFVGRFARESFDLRHVGTFLLYQVVAVTPLVLCVAIVVYARLFRAPRRLFRRRWVITVCFSLPLLLGLGYKSLSSEIHLNWTLPLFLALLPALAHWLVVQLRHARTALERQRHFRRWVWTALICVLFNAGFMAYLLTLQPRLQLISAFGPWRQLAELVEQHEERLERETGREPLIVGEGKYRLASVLAFYRKPLELKANSANFTTSGWIFGRKGLAYPYWTSGQRWQGVDCVYVVDDDDDDILKEVQPLFESVEIVDDPRLQSLGRDKYRLAICRGLKRVPSGSSLRSGKLTDARQ